MAVSKETIKFIVDHIDEVMENEDIIKAIEEREKRLKENLPITGDDVKLYKKYRLEIDELVGNLFFTLKKNLIPAKEVSFNLIEDYGDLLKNKLKDKNINVLLDLSRDNTIKFLAENRNLYTISEDNSSIIINDNTTLETLINKYHGYLPLDILLVILDGNVMSKTVEMYNNDNIKKLILKKKIR